MIIEKQLIVLGLFRSGRYKVDVSTGDVISLIGKVPRIKAHIDVSGYKQYILDMGYMNNISVYGHIMTYLYAYGTYDPDYIIDHKNGDKGDNRLSNIQCITQRENIERSGQNTATNKHKKPRLPESVKVEMVGMFQNGSSFSDIARHYGCHRHNVSVIIRNRLGDVEAFSYRDALANKFKL